MSDAPETVSIDDAMKCFIQTQVVTNQELRALPALIAQKLRLSRSQEMLIRNIVLDAITAISQSADATLSEYTDMVGFFRPLDSLSEFEINECPEWYFTLMRKAAEEQAGREIHVNFKGAMRGEI